MRCRGRIGFRRLTIAYALKRAYLRQDLPTFLRQIRASSEVGPPRAPSIGEFRHARCNDRCRLRRAGIGRMLLGVRVQRDVRRGRAGENCGPPCRRRTDLRTGAGAAGRRQRRGRAALLHQRDRGRRAGRQRGDAGGRHAEPTRRRPRRSFLHPRGRPPGCRHARRLHRDRDQVDGARRHRARNRADHPGAAAGCDLRHRLEPGVPARGLGDRRFHAPRPGHRRGRIDRGASGHAGALQAALSHRDSGAVHLTGNGGAHQVRRQLLPRDQDHLHQRDRGPLRAGSAPTSRTSPRGLDSTAALDGTSCTRAPVLAVLASPRTSPHSPASPRKPARPAASWRRCCAAIPRARP